MSATIAVQAAVVAALEGVAGLNGAFDGPPARAAFPYASVDCASADWGSKSWRGREVRVAVTLWDSGEEAGRLHGLMAAVEVAVEGIAGALDGWRVASTLFLRSRVVRDATGPWAGLVEFRVRVVEV